MALAEVKEDECSDAEKQDNDDGYNDFFVHNWSIISDFGCKISILFRDVQMFGSVMLLFRLYFGRAGRLSVALESEGCKLHHFTPLCL